MRRGYPRIWTGCTACDHGWVRHSEEEEPFCDGCDKACAGEPDPHSEDDEEPPDFNDRYEEMRGRYSR